MKKIILMLAVVMTFALVACGGRQTQKDAEVVETEVSVEYVQDADTRAEGADTVEVVETPVTEVVDAE